MIHDPPSAVTAAAAPKRPGPETKAERVERQAKMLRELAAITMSIARAEEQVAMARAAQALNAAESGLPRFEPPGSRPAPKDNADPGLAIARIARTVRLTLAMENRLYDDLAAEAAASAAAAKPEPSVEEKRRTEAGVRGCIHGATIVPVVEQAIEAAEDPKGDGGDTERRLDHLHERLADEDEIVSFGTLPIGASIARLCAELGLTPDWSLWEDEDWAIEEAETDAPGSPYGRSWRAAEDRDGGDEVCDPAERAETVDPP